MNDRTPPLGSMRDRVELQRKSTVIGADTGAVVNYIPITKVWARVYERTGKVFVQADARTAQASHVVVMRFRNDISPGDRIVHRGNALDVETIADLNGRRAYLSCSCTQAQIAG